MSLDEVSKAELFDEALEYIDLWGVDGVLKHFEDKCKYELQTKRMLEKSE